MHHSTTVSNIIVFVFNLLNYESAIVYYTTSANHDGFSKNVMDIVVHIIL